MESSSRDLMTNAIRLWMRNLNKYPGWKEWKRKHLGYTMTFDEHFTLHKGQMDNEFKFSEQIENQHSLLMKYLGLQETISAVRDCEFYFRRYPFQGLPVTRNKHLLYVCEMYFDRFYQFKVRLSDYFKSLKTVSPENKLDVGEFIKRYKNVFDKEIRERNSVHHGRGFEDVAIDRIMIAGIFSTDPPDKHWRREQISACRKFSNEWVRRVRKRSEVLEQFLEAVAQATLKECGFLTELLQNSKEGKHRSK